MYGTFQRRFTTQTDTMTTNPLSRPSLTQSTTFFISPYMNGSHMGRGHFRRQAAVAHRQEVRRATSTTKTIPSRTMQTGRTVAATKTKVAVRIPGRPKMAYDATLTERPYLILKLREQRTAS